MDSDELDELKRMTDSVYESIETLLQLNETIFWEFDSFLKKYISRGGRHKLVCKRNETLGDMPEFKRIFSKENAAPTEAHNQSFTTIATMTTGVPASITQVGLIRYYDGRVAWKYSTDVDPDGAGEARAFSDIAPDMQKHLHEQIAVCYGSDAKESIEAAFEKAGLACPEVRWLDCRKVVQRIWSKRCGPDCDLGDVAHMIRHRYRPGSTIEDAKAIGAVLIEAIAETGFTAEAWSKMVEGRGRQVK